MDPRKSRGPLHGCFFALLLFSVTAAGQNGGANSWTKPTSGAWEEPFWSLGVLPNSSQSVLITNQGWKAVAINPSTPISFPDSMTVGSLTIRGAWDTMNTLLLNYAGTAVPLTVLNGLEVGDSARIVNINSALDVQGGTINVTNAEIIQDGGVVRTTNAAMTLQGSVYQLTNGVFEGGQVLIGAPVSASFNQYGGTAVIADLRFGAGAPAAGGTYALYGGELSLPGGMRMLGGNGAQSAYFQAGGTNRTTTIFLEPNLFGLPPTFTLNGGLLTDNDVNMVGDNFGGITIEQNGGTHVVSNILNIAGGARHAEPVPSAYYLNGGVLSVRIVALAGREGSAYFIQSNGITQAESIQGNASPDFGYSTVLTLAGGTMSCSNVFSDNGVNDTYQSGGTLVVSNALAVGGFRDRGFKVYSRYVFTGGTLSASNISVEGEWIIGDSSGTPRITNAGTCSVWPTLRISNAVERLGRFILTRDVTVDLAGTASRLSFADSSGEIWEAARLTVANWNGNPSGGGAEQLKFGTSQSGLMPAQLAQIGFSNPVGLPEGEYPAVILPTGELVPGQRPALDFMRSSNGLVISWSGSYQLTTSTNVLGPWAVITNATSPYTNAFNELQRFFVLRSP